MPDKKTNLLLHPATGNPLIEEKEHFYFSFKNNDIFFYYAYKTHDFLCIFNQITKYETWEILKKALWKKCYFNFTPLKRHYDFSRIPQNTAPKFMTLLSSQAIKYDNIAAYWKIIDHQPLLENEKKNSPFTLKYTIKPIFWKLDEPSDPLVLDLKKETLPLELSENENVQFSHPSIKNLIHLLPDPVTCNRLEMAKHILALVHKTLTYDHDAFKNKRIDSFQTVEIYERKKGVCQHFANLYAALARGVGLPTRIIMGWHLNRPHAWNEIEIRKGVWRPIEPGWTTVYFSTYEVIPVEVAFEKLKKKFGLRPSFITHFFMETLEYHISFFQNRSQLFDHP